MGYQVTQKSKYTWLIQGEKSESMYLTVGENRALLVDAGMEEDSLKAVVGSLTDKPVILALTHAHFDHVGQSGEFKEVYLDPEDMPFYRAQAAENSFHLNLCPADDIRSMPEVFDLGGMTIRTVRLPGHTPGSVLLVNEKAHEVFTGDAVGSGCLVLMGGMLGGCPLPVYKEALLTAVKKLEALGVTDDWTFYGGHSGQEYLSKVSAYNPVKMQLIKDMAELCDAIKAGTCYTEEMTMPGPIGGKFRYSRWKTAEMQYDETIKNS